MFAGVVYRSRLESAWVEMPRGFESHSILQEMWLSGLKHSPRKRAGSNASWVRIPPSPPGMAAIGAAHRLESGWAARLCGFESHPFLQGPFVYRIGRQSFKLVSAVQFRDGLPAGVVKVGLQRPFKPTEVGSSPIARTSPSDVEATYLPSK